jgi:hypothetical protein
LVIEKLEIEKTKTTFTISVLKVVYWKGLVLPNSKFLINKNSQGRKSVCEKSTYSCKFGFRPFKVSTYHKTGDKLKFDE